MARKGRRYLLAALLIVVVAACAAQAREPEHRHWEASAVAGVSFLGDVSSSGATARYGDGYLVGVRVTENKWRHLGFTFGYAFSNQPLTLTGFPGQASSLGLSHGVHRFAYDLVIYPYDEVHRLRPYAFFGPGVSIFRVADKEQYGLSSPVKFAFSVGGGIKYLVADHLAVGFEYRDTFSDAPRYAIPGFDPSGLVHNSQISVAFHYEFGY